MTDGQTLEEIKELAPETLPSDVQSVEAQLDATRKNPTKSKKKEHPLRTMSRKKTQRKRTKHFHFMVTEEDKALIYERMAAMGVTSVGAYFRKMGIDGYFINIDLSVVHELVSLLRYCSNNLNQYAKRANETGSIYTSDIEDLQNRLDDIWVSKKNVLHSLSEIQL